MAASRSFSARLTAKVGPLPVWVWAVVLLLVGYLVYRLTQGGGTGQPAATDTTTTAAGDNSQPSTDLSTAGNVTAAQDAGTDTGSLNDQVLSQLSGFGSSIDALTAAVQSSPAFWPGSGDSGSGSVVPNGTTPPNQVDYSTPKLEPSGPAGGAPAPAGAKPAATVTKAPATVHYYTFAPGKAPKNRKADEAPARGPAGTTLRFARGRGYYYA